MINEWELDLDIDEIDAAVNETLGPAKTEPPAPPAPVVEVVSAGPAKDPIKAPAEPAPVVIEEKDKKKSDLKAIEEKWTKQLDQAAAARDTVDQDANPQLWDWENHIWAQDQMQYVNEWNERAGDEADFEWEKNARAILEDVVADYTRKYGMTVPQTAPIDTGDWDTGAPEATSQDLIDPIIKRNIFDSSKAQGAPPEKEQMIRTAITGPKEGRLPKPSKRKELAEEYTEAGLTSQLDVATGRALTPERMAASRSAAEAENAAMITQLEEQIAGLDEQIADTESGSVESEGLIKDRQRLREQLAPRLTRQQRADAVFRREVRGEMPGGPVRISGVPIPGHRQLAMDQGQAMSRAVYPLFEPFDQASETSRLGIDVPLAAEDRLVSQGRLTNVSTAGRRLAPALPAEIVLGREAGGVTVYRHTDTDEEIRINPDDFTKAGNEQHLADLKAGKLERLGFEKVEKPGEAYTDVGDKVRIAAVRVAIRLKQIKARRAQVQDLVSSLQQEAEQKAQPKWQAEGRHRDRTDRVFGRTPPMTGFIGVVDDIQAYQRELATLEDLEKRLFQIRDRTLGGYAPSAEDYERFKGDVDAEGLPGSVRESREAKEAIEEQSGQGE